MAKTAAKAGRRAPKAPPRRAPVANLSGHAVVEALKDTHFKRAVRAQMASAQERENARMAQERWDDMTRGMTKAALQDFLARAPRP